ncbi:MAG: hypothetical protein OEU92_09570 [Alphaproteobacteria bacterium]|nr:hypothetical protein [Alphaproteobacteria bacterium]
MSIASTSVECRAHINSARSIFTRHNSGTGQNNDTTFDLAFDTWTSILMLMGPFDGGSTGTNIGYADGSKNADNDATANISENFTQIKIGGDHEIGTNTSAWPAQIAEVFVFNNITEANADTIASEATTTLPDAFSIEPDHYWPFLSNGTATLGGNNMTSGGSPTYDAGEHPSLSGGGGGGTPSPIVVIVDS